MSPVKMPKRSSVERPKLAFARIPPVGAQTVDAERLAFRVGSTYFFVLDSAVDPVVVSAVCVNVTATASGRSVGDFSTDDASIRVGAERAFRSFAACDAAFGLAGRGPGRPRATEKRETPVRQLGRVADAEFEEMQQAARLLGVSFSAFARETLLRRARDVIRRHANATG